MRRKGKLIVIDGTDGSGKKTQTQLLLERLQNAGYPALSVSFPQYGKKSAGLVEEYLGGRYGQPDEISPYAASLFYALDRFDLSAEIRVALDAGKIVVTNRYVTANAGHQGGKIKNLSERKKFLAWLYDTEYRVLGVPRPDMVVILHVPTAIGKKLIRERQKRLFLKRQDVHETNPNHLRAAEECYLWLAKQYPESHVVVECAWGGKLSSREAIKEKLWQTVFPLLPKHPDTKENPNPTKNSG